jgi:uncharacterized membrane protein YhfC
LAGAVERLSAVGLHIGLSVMVWQSVKHRSWLWFLTAILVHAFFDAASVMLVTMGVGTWAIEAVVFSLALVIVLWTIKTTKREWAIQMENEPTPAEIAAA